MRVIIILHLLEKNVFFDLILEKQALASTSLVSGHETRSEEQAETKTFEIVLQESLGWTVSFFLSFILL